MIWKYIYLAVLYLISSLATHAVLTAEGSGGRILGLLVLATAMWCAVEIDRACAHAAAKSRGCRCKCHD